MVQPALASEPVLALDNVVFSYGGAEVLHGISFSLAPGEIVGLLGPNGAAKTTTIRVLNTLLPPQEGVVEVLGYDVRRSPMTIRRGLRGRGIGGAMDLLWARVREFWCLRSGSMR